ncbi:MAG: hypothetical protein KBD00_05070 [Candidatus Peribacteraceae bacterium]|nr:hypothetical protein [Candidatus Peribacteraceae bacterium]
MSDFLQQMSDAPDLSTKDQKEMGKAQAGKISDDHLQFLQKILSLIDAGTIDPVRPETFIDKTKYDALPQEGKTKVDLSLVNIASQLQHVTEFHLSKHTPDESPQLETMISHLQDILERLEEVRSIFLF